MFQSMIESSIHSAVFRSFYNIMNVEKYLSEKLSSHEGQKYLEFRRRNEQEADELYKKVKDEIAECHLSVTEAKGFLEFMKLVIEELSYIPVKE
jgi:hypothetical protein